jgi:DnaK suppressor protein
MAALTAKQLETFRKRLEAERDELLRLSQATAEDAKPVELDQTKVGRLSRMDAMQVQAMAAESDRRREIEIKRIDAALKRLDEDEFGYCTSCGEDIAPKRLDSDPSAPLCIDCAGKGG